MENQVNNTMKNRVKYWYLPLLLGIVFIMMGIWVFRTPVASYITLALLFAFTFLVTGIIEIISAIANRKELDNWGWSLTGGIIDLVLGVLLIATPGMSMVMLPFYIGFGILFRSMMAVGWALEMRKQKVIDWVNLLAVGIIGIIFAFIMLWNPVFAGMTIVFYTGFAFIMVGIFQVYFSFRLKKLRQ
ncbi:HdeD family acid-resistance protein [Rufibacter sp. XAAS-G3-1]|uniref:HdeD family acid-resistance protein n=1 Tax=Rufibacter sp. XAAS-G3-1 TaxID=2729134 RepID=UPI0015E72C0F|nr:DUF308 domain-containing protein [Rufibacter sp. XAAS-G3-1]